MEHLDEAREAGRNATWHIKLAIDNLSNQGTCIFLVAFFSLTAERRGFEAV